MNKVFLTDFDLFRRWFNLEAITITINRSDIDIILESLETYKSLASHEHLKYSYDDIQFVYNFFKRLL